MLKFSSRFVRVYQLIHISIVKKYFGFTTDCPHHDARMKQIQKVTVSIKCLYMYAWNVPLIH